jgi:hypothetical protein
MVVPCGSQTFYAYSPLYASAMPSTVWTLGSHYVRMPMPRAVVFSPRGAGIRSHPGVAAQRAPLMGRCTVSVAHDTDCSLDAGWACLIAGLVRRERTLLAELLLCNDTEQHCTQLDDASAGIRRGIAPEHRALPALLYPGDRWQPGEGAWYISSKTLLREEHQRW